MWQAPSQRVRAIANQKKRERERYKRPIHVQRVEVHVKVLNPRDQELKEADVRVFFNDISSGGMGIYCNSKLPIGREIELTLSEPTEVKIKGRVVWCQEQVTESHILSNRPYAFRAGVEFLFDTVDDQKKFNDFFEEVHASIVRSKAG